MKRYNIYYKKYNIIARDYIPHISVLETDDIYHEIGKLIANSLESIKNINYCEAEAPIDVYDKLWQQHGYRKINETTWRMEIENDSH